MTDREFEALLIQTLPKLRRYAISLSRRQDVADDLVQTTVERAVSARHRFDPDTSLDAWLFRILRNAWIDETRRTKTRGVQLDVTDMTEAASFDGVRDIEARLALSETEAALATLSPDQQEILRLICFDELSYLEAAEVLGVPKGTVMSRLARARVALAEKLGIK